MKNMSEHVCVPACSVRIYVCVSTGAYVCVSTGAYVWYIEKGFEMHVLPLLFLKDGFELLPSTCCLNWKLRLLVLLSYFYFLSSKLQIWINNTTSAP
jgi:hypothetical protein